MATENDTLNDMFVVPFDSLNNDDFLHVNSPVGMNDSLYEIYEKCTTFNFCSFKYSDHDAGDFDNNIDPDTCCITILKQSVITTLTISSTQICKTLACLGCQLYTLMQGV